MADERARAAAPHPRADAVADAQKHAAALAAAELVEDGMRVGLGTGSTVAHVLPALARRRLELRCVSSSPGTSRLAADLGLPLASLDELGGTLDIAIDGADQIDPAAWLVKGGGGALTREKILAAAARRFVVIASAEKAVGSLSPPVPLEVMRFAAAYTLRALPPARLRDCPPSPDGNLIADYTGAVGSPPALAARLASTPGVVEHGLFEPELVSDILIGTASGVVHRHGGSQPG